MASDAARATLVVCAGGQHQGVAVQTCPYIYKNSLHIIGSHGPVPTNVTFHKIAIPVTAYELRTGKPVFDGTVQISGPSCPSHVDYTTYDGLDSGPPPDMNVKPSTADVRAAFSPVINR